MVRIEDVTKSFGGVRSLKGVNLHVLPGEIHAILGENGAGKSTLMKILSGAYIRDSGKIFIDNEEVNFRTPLDAREKGLGIIYQEFSLIPALTAAENIFIHKLEEKKIINWKKLYAEADLLVKQLGFEIDTRKTVAELSIAQQQIVEIAKAMSEDLKILILDEPSAVLGPADIQKLFSSLRRLKEKGVAIIYISHHLEELFELTDRITVLKDGNTIVTLTTSATNKDELVEAMLGRSLNTMFPEKNPIEIPQPNVFEIQGIRPFKNEQDISLIIRSGEVIGIGGLVGSGRTEVLRAIFGADVQVNKQIKKNGKSIKVSNPKIAVWENLAMVPEDRKQHGGILNLSIKENISMAAYGKTSNKLGFIQKEKENQNVNQLVSSLKVKIHHINQPLETLSGGNQQKVVLAKWLNTDAELLLIDEPTRGVDVGARAEIYSLINELRLKGLAIIVVSSDWEELMGLSDKILVMKAGVVTAVFEDKKEFSVEKLLRAAIGAVN